MLTNSKEMDITNTKMIESMLSDMEDAQQDVLLVAPVVQRITQTFERSMLTAAKIIADQEAKLKILHHREYVQQMMIIGVSTLAYFAGVWMS